MLANAQIIKNGLSCNDCFNISVKNRILTMHYIGGAVVNDFSIPISAMSGLTMDHWFGSQQVDFLYHDLKFKFIENGYGDIDYLKKNLFQKNAA